MNARRNAVRLGIATMLITLAGALPAGLATAQQKLILKASDAHPEGYPTVAAVEKVVPLAKVPPPKFSVPVVAASVPRFSVLVVSVPPLR